MYGKFRLVTLQKVTIGQAIGTVVFMVMTTFWPMAILGWVIWGMCSLVLLNISKFQSELLYRAKLSDAEYTSFCKKTTQYYMGGAIAGAVVAAILLPLIGKYLLLVGVPFQMIVIYLEWKYLKELQNIK